MEACVKAVPQGSVVPFWESFVVYTTFSDGRVNLRRSTKLAAQRGHCLELKTSHPAACLQRFWGWSGCCLLLYVSAQTSGWARFFAQSLG